MRFLFLFVCFFLFFLSVFFFFFHLCIIAAFQAYIVGRDLNKGFALLLYLYISTNAQTRQN